MIGTQDDIVNVKVIRHAIEENSGQEVLSAKNQLIYSLKRLAKSYEKLSTRPIESTNITGISINEPLPQIVKHSITADFEVKKSNNFVKQVEMATIDISI